MIPHEAQRYHTNHTSRVSPLSTPHALHSHRATAAGNTSNTIDHTLDTISDTMPDTITRPPQAAKERRMILDAEVSLFHGSHDTTVSEHVSLGTVLDRIQHGTYRPYVEQLRDILHTKGEQAYKQAKEKSIAFTPSCRLTTRAQAVPWTEKLQACTGLVHLDCDHLDDPEAFKATLAEDPAVVFAFISPRGNGLKLGIAAEDITDAKSYSHAWSVAVGRLQTRYPDVHINVDPHVKYLNALCYMSYDPTPYVNGDAVPLGISLPTPRTTTSTPTANVVDYAKVMQALFCIPTVDAYDDWLTIGMALHSTGESWAREAWDTWSRQSAKYEEKAQETKWRSFKADGQTTINTLFHRAKQHGWRPPTETVRQPHQARTVPDMTQPASHEPQAPRAPQRSEPDEPWELEILPWAGLETEHIQWLWWPYIPLGELTMLYGDPGVGKSLVTVALAAALSCGTALPDQQGETTLPLPGKQRTLFFAKEDHLQATTLPRFLACGGDQAYVSTCTGLHQNGSQRKPFVLTQENLQLLEATIRDEHPALVVIDPIMAYLGARIDASKAEQVRPILEELAQIARRNHCAIVCINHQSKGSQGMLKAMLRGLASVVFAGTARSVLSVEQHPTEKHQALLCHAKTNLGTPGRTHIFGKDKGAFTWEGISRLNVEEVAGDRRPTGPAAHTFFKTYFSLEGKLQGGVPMPAEDLLTWLEEEGDLRRDVIYRAKAALGVVSKKRGLGKDGYWEWSLPEMEFIPTPLEVISGSSSSSSSSGSYVSSDSLDKTMSYEDMPHPEEPQQAYVNQDRVEIKDTEDPVHVEDTEESQDLYFDADLLPDSPLEDEIPELVEDDPLEMTLPLQPSRAPECRLRAHLAASSATRSVVVSLGAPDCHPAPAPGTPPPSAYELLFKRPAPEAWSCGFCEGAAFWVNSGEERRCAACQRPPVPICVHCRHLCGDEGVVWKCLFCKKPHSQ